MMMKIQRIFKNPLESLTKMEKMSENERRDLREIVLEVGEV